MAECPKEGHSDLQLTFLLDIQDGIYKYELTSIDQPTRGCDRYGRVGAKADGGRICVGTRFRSCSWSGVRDQPNQATYFELSEIAG